jgi:cell division septation protein DedD
MGAKLDEARVALKAAGFRLYTVQENSAGIEVTIVGNDQDRARAYATVKQAVGKSIAVVIIY